MALGVSIPCVTVLYTAAFLYVVPYVCLCDFDAVDMARGIKKKHLWASISKSAKKKHSVGLPTTLLRKKSFNSFTPTKPATLYICGRAGFCTGVKGY